MAKLTPLQAYYLKQYEESREYTELCLSERKRYQDNPEAYQSKDAPERIRDHAQVCIENVKSGVSSTMFRGAEDIQMSTAYKVCTSMGLPDDQPMIELADKALEDHADEIHV